MYFHDSPLSPGPSGGAGTSTFKNGSYVICGNAQKMKVRGGFLGFSNALKKQNLVVEPDPLFKRADYRWVGKLPPRSVKSSARFWIALRFTSKGVKYLRVLRGTGLVIAILASGAEIYVAKDKWRATVKAVGGLAGATAATAMVQGLFLLGPDEFGGPIAWGANVIADVSAGTTGYTVGTKVTENVYDLIINPNPANLETDLH